MVQLPIIMTEKSGSNPSSPESPDSAVLEAKPESKTKRPPFYKVLLLNDDYTPMDFVVKVLETIYHHSSDEAISIMMQVHQKGKGLCGVYTRDVAETKVDQTLYLARQNDHPLQCVTEQD